MLRTIRVGLALASRGRRSISVRNRLGIGVTSSNGTQFTSQQLISGGDVVFPAVAANNGKIAVS